VLKLLDNQLAHMAQYCFIPQHSALLLNIYTSHALHTVYIFFTTRRTYLRSTVLLLYVVCRVGIVGGRGVEPPVHVYRHPFLSENRL